MNLILRKKSGDVYAICATVILATAVFSMSIGKINSANLEVHVYVRDTVVYEMPLAKDQIYVFYKPADATNEDVADAPADYSLVELSENEGQYLLGPITVSVENKKIDVLKETSAHHYCSIMPATGQANWSLTCAPNFFRVVIEEASQ